MKIISIVGARPQFVKLAPLSRLVRKEFPEIIIHTGQHFDEEMSELFFKELAIPEPAYNLDINRGDHGVQTGRMLIALENLLKELEPDLILIFGDTNTTLAGAIVAAKLHFPVIHIEAGLRSLNKTMPEEINRIIADHSSNYLFAPTKTAMTNLEKEGLADIAHLTGDIMVDALLTNIIKAQKSDVINRFDLIPDNYYLMTLHRPYNVDDPDKLQLILKRLSAINKTIVFPVHPRTRKIINENGFLPPENILLSNPLGYLDFLCLENYASKILTDSGGIQKEAYILKKPCITIRPETEWIETVEDGWNILADPHNENFIDIIKSFNPDQPQRDIFGKDVAERMFGIIKGLQETG